MNPKALLSSLTLLFSLAISLPAKAVTPVVVQSSMSSGPSAPITLTLPATPKPGNMLFAVVGFGIYGERNFNPPDSSWTCTLGAGGGVHINTCSHVVVSGDGTSYTFVPTSTDGPGVEGVMVEASGTVAAQIGYSYSGNPPGNVSVTSSPSLVPSVIGTLPLSFTSGGAISTPGDASWITLQSDGGLGAFMSGSLTTNTTTPISTTFHYFYSNFGNSLQELLLLVPGSFAATPVTSVAAGSYASMQSVVLSDSSPGAIIHYTLDGSIPTCSSAVYATPIRISATATLSFMACAAGYANSAIQTATYVVGGGTLAGISLGPMGDLHGYVPFAGDAFHQDISASPVDSNSVNIMAGIGASHLHHDWSSVNGGNYGIPYIVVDSSVTPPVPFLNQLYSDESDLTLYPIPMGLPIESTPPNCTITGDNHAIILDKATGVDYEFYRAQYCPGNTPQWQAANGVLWDTTTVEKRPYGYTSVDAAGLSVFEGLVRYDEIAAGAINHAIRFTTALTRCDHYDNGDGVGAYVLPATHAACNNSGTLNVMGMRIRLKASFDISGYSRVNQIILTAMKKYGMILADNGSSLYFQGTPDARWDDNDLTALEQIGTTDLEVIQMPTIYTNDSHPTGAAPVINALTPTSPTIVAGQSVTLNSAVTGASYSYIDNAGFMRNSSMTVAPTQTTTYTLTSRNAFGSASMATTVTVVPAPTKDPALTVTPVAAQTLGGSPVPVSATSLSSGQITYSIVSGPATISGNMMTLTGVGTVVLEASQVSAGLYTAATATATFAVNGIPPGLAFAAIADKTYGVLPFSVSAQSNSPATISYSVVSGPASVSGRTVSVSGAGTVTLQASQAAAGNYAAGTAQVSFAVKPVAPTLSLAPVAAKVYGTAPFTVSSTSNSNGGDIYSVVSGPASVAGNTVTLTGAGTVVLMVSQAAAGNYSAGTATTSFRVLPGVPQLLFAAIPAQTYGAGPVALNASSLSTGAVSYSVVSGPAAMAGNMLSINGAGTITLFASQAATANYTAAFALTTIVVGKQHPAATLQISTPLVNYLTPVSFDARLGTSGKTSPTGTIQVLDGTKVIGIYTMNAVAGGDLRSLLPTDLAVGAHTLTFVYSGDANYSSSTSAAVALTIRTKPVGMSPTL